MAVNKIEDGGESGKETNVAGKIEVDGKEYSAEDVQNLVKLGASATTKMQEVAGIKAAAEKYGVDTETYLGQAEGAFGVMSELIASKVIDEKGNVLKVEGKEKESEGGKPGGESDLDKLFNLTSGGTGELKGVDKVAAIVAKALEPQLEGIKKLGEKVSTIDKTQGDMIRLSLEEKVMTKFPNLKATDVSQVFGSAMNDKSKTLWEHAEAASKVRATDLGSLREEHAKEFGVDLSKFDENKLKEQEAGGGAGVLFKGKKFNFNPKKGDTESVTPMQAANEYLDAISSK